MAKRPDYPNPKAIRITTKRTDNKRLRAAERERTATDERKEKA